MGLAASQARLLFITMRQNDVSAKMQKISNENLVLARDAEDLEAKYKKMKNVETYQVGGVDLSYDLLMGTQAAQNGTLTLLQSGGRAVVLSPSMASNLGLSNPGSVDAFKSKWPDQTKFISKMTGMDEANVKTIVNEINGSSNAGNGSSDSKNELSINGFLASLSGGTTDAVWTLNGDAKGTNLKNYFGTDSASTVHNRLFHGNNWSKDDKSGEIVPASNSDGGIVGIFGTGINSYGQKRDKASVQIAKKGMSLQDLYSKAGTFESTMIIGSLRDDGRDWDKKISSWTDAEDNFEKFANLVKESLCGAISEYMNKNAVEVVKNATYSLCNTWKSTHIGDKGGQDFYQQRAAELGMNWNDAGFDRSEDAVGAALMACQGQTGIVAASDDGNAVDFAIDAGKFVKDLINNIMNTLTGGACYDKYAISESSKYDTNTSFTILSKYTTTDAETTTPKTADEIGKANVAFYKNMYNAMATYGYIVDENVNSSSYLNEKLQNNQYTVNGTSVDNSKTVTKKVDENAKAEAKEFYDMEMEKIKRKEKLLDNDLTSLQTEYSSLTNDYNSVKGLVDANIQRSFTYCQQG